ncbi:MAG: hypothetical protein RQ760_20450, partial [Sedimentisphaerales bacterium]|nr:hypothetical protein [Sedimentisphaerales bacterium]
MASLLYLASNSAFSFSSASAFAHATASVASALRTYTVHAATQISKELKGSSEVKVLVTGGGAFNNYLMKEVQE